MSKDNYFDTKIFLLSLQSKILTQEINEGDYFIIDRLCKKIDVVKRLYRFYSEDISTKKSDEEVSIELYIVFLEALQSEKYSDFKFLNTALKLNDILRARGYVELKDAQAKNKKMVTRLARLHSTRGFYNA